MIRKGDMLRVEWEDIQDHQNDDWNDVMEISTASIVTLGWALQNQDEDPNTLRVARDKSIDDDTYRSCMAIPVGCITGIQILQKNREAWDVGTQET